MAGFCSSPFHHGSSKQRFCIAKHFTTYRLRRHFVILKIAFGTLEVSGLTTDWSIKHSLREECVMYAFIMAIMDWIHSFHPTCSITHSANLCGIFFGLGTRATLLSMPFSKSSIRGCTEKFWSTPITSELFLCYCR